MLFFRLAGLPRLYNSRSTSCRLPIVYGAPKGGTDSFVAFQVPAIECQSYQRALGLFSCIFDCYVSCSLISQAQPGLSPRARKRLDVFSSPDQLSKSLHGSHFWPSRKATPTHIPANGYFPCPVDRLSAEAISSRLPVL